MTQAGRPQGWLWAGKRPGWGRGSPELHCWSSGHSLQAARPGPWKRFLGMPRPPPQEAHGAARIFIVLRAQPAGGPQNPSVQGGGTRSALCSAAAAWTTSGGRCRRLVLLSSAPEAAQGVVGLHLLGGKVAGQLPTPTPTLGACCYHLARSPGAEGGSCCARRRRQPSRPPPSSSHGPQAIGTEKQVLPRSRAHAGGLQSQPCDLDRTTEVWGQLWGLRSLARAVCVHTLETKGQGPGDVPWPS